MIFDPPRATNSTKIKSFKPQSHLSNLKFNEHFYKLSQKYPVVLLDHAKLKLNLIFYATTLVFLIISYILLELFMNANWANITMLYGVLIFPGVILIRYIVRQKLTKKWMDKLLQDRKIHMVP